MLTSTEISKIEALQDSQERVRRVAYNVLNKYNVRNLVNISKLAIRVINGDKLSNQETQKIIDVAKEVNHPIPTNRRSFVLETLKQQLVYRHFNAFGQELK